MPTAPHLGAKLMREKQLRGEACETIGPSLWQAASPVRTVPARRIIRCERDLDDAVPVVCRGWAASFVMLADASRQILSFLLPGDMFSAAFLFESQSHCTVEAITEVDYRAFKRGEMKAMLLKQPDLFENFYKAWAEEKSRADQLIVDLGRRSAEERIARLILNLAARLAPRGLGQTENVEIEFPLRQHHIADATGLTPVHVSKVLSELRRGGLIELSGRTLTILDLERFRRLAYMR